MTVNEFYRKVDGDYTDAINRLQSDVLIRKFLKMLPGDNSMTLLAEAVEKSEAAQAFRAVHTLKGMALNLSLSALAEVCSAMTELLRGKEALPAEAGQYYDAVRREYERVREALEELE